MTGRGTAARRRGHPSGSAQDPIPSEIDETIERRLAELRPLHDEYTQLLSYRRLIGVAATEPDAGEQTHAPSRATTGAARAAILAALAEGPKTRSELTLELPFNAASMRYNLRRLTRTGLIVESGHEDAPSYALANEEPDRP